MKIGTRLAVLLGVLALLLLAVGVGGFLNLDRANKSLNTMFEQRMVPTHQLDQINFLMVRNRLALSNVVTDPSAERVIKYTNEVEQNIAAITKLWAGYSLIPKSQESVRLLDLHAETRKKFIQKGLCPAIVALRANDFKEAQRIVLNVLNVTYDATRAHLTALIENNRRDAQAESLTAQASYKSVRNISMI